MKKYRRIVSLVLVFALAFALMATCVSARATCPDCGSGDAVTISNELVSTTTQTVSGCSKYSVEHTHTIKRYKATIICRSCDRTVYEYTTITTCA